ncbi:hypothetical protein JOE59_000270 [Agromyces cerinus]|uniref:hypothetical protein n=1 Tax=Agromyces cerinus TaxID=33878 RepID=UPI00195A7A83|nr:hypothetical protein [Agromyces cerinus]MBM7829565.1 hypothetical protein [Agromyces cerinus]
MRRRRRIVRRAAPLALVAALALAGCSQAPPEVPPTPSHFELGDLDPSQIDGNGLWLLTGTDAAGEVVDAVAAAGTVEYSGTFTELTAATPEADPARGRTVAVDYRGRPGAFAAKITAGGLSLDVVTVGGHTYMRGNAAYAAQLGIPELEQGYVCAAAGDGLADQWSPLLRPADLVSALLGASGSVSVAQPAADAELLEVVVGGETAPAGVMHVQRVGAPLPTDFTAGDPSGDGSFAFGAWGEELDIEAPADLVRDCAASE